MFGEFIHSFLYEFVQIERRTEPFWRPYANQLFREPAAAVLQALINLQRKNEQMALAEEKAMPGEEEALD